MQELPLSRVGLGCNAFGRRVDLAGARATVDAALDAGVTHLDTADIYGDGDSERFLGEILAGRRDRVVLATKFGAPGSVAEQATAPFIRKALDASLARLCTDRIDLYYYHRPDGATPIAETLGALADLAAEGKIRRVGCSNLDAALLREAIASGVPVFALQNEYSLLERGVEAEILPLCREHGIGLVPYFPLVRGLLTDTPRPEKLAAAKPEQLERREAVARFAGEHGRSVLEVAIGWLATRPGVVSVIAGASSAAQARANGEAGRWTPTPAEIAALDEL